MPIQGQAPILDSIPPTIRKENGLNPQRVDVETVVVVVLVVVVVVAVVPPPPPPLDLGQHNVKSVLSNPQGG